MKRFYLDSIDSTNDYCKKNLSFLPSFCVVYTLIKHMEKAEIKERG